MRSDQVISLVKQYKNNHHQLNQIAFHSHIDEELLNQVSEAFPEYDREAESPLLFYVDANEYYQMPKWIMLTETRLYYSMYYYPYQFRVIDSIALNRINSFEIITRKWPRDSFVRINDKKYYSIEVKRKKEAKILSEFINSVIDLADRTVIEEIDSLGESTENLENVALFTIAKEYFYEENRGGRVWGFECFYYGPFIPEEKLEIAREEYANYDDQREKAIIYIDNSWVGRIGHVDPSGLIITNKYLYYKLKKKFKDKKFSIGKILLKDIKTFQIKIRFFSWIVINKGKITFKMTQFTRLNKWDIRVLEGLMQKFIQTLNNTD